MFLQRSLVCIATIVFFNAQTRAADPPKEEADQPSVWVTSIAQIGTSEQFVASTANGLLLRESTVTSFDASDPTKLSPLYTHPAAAWCVDSTDDGQTIASVDYRGNLVIYDVASKKPTTHEKAFERWCQALLISPDNQLVVAGNEAGKLMTWDIQAAKVGKSIELDEHAITGLAFSSDKKLLAASDGAGHVHLLKWPSLEEAGKIEVSKETVWCVAFADNDQSLICGSSDRNLYRCDAKADAKPETIAKGKDWITRIAISHNGQVAASEVGGRLHFPSAGGTVSMDAKSGVWALCWNGDQQLIAGTRKHGLITAGQSWKWTEPKKPEPKKPEGKAEQKKPAADEPAKDSTPETKTDDKKKAAAKPGKEQPAGKSSDAKTTGGKEKDAEKEDAEKKNADKEAPAK
ncbi:WD40 repeat domain-containing protein [Stieleria marina]